MDTNVIRPADSDARISRCFTVMRELRQGIDEIGFLSQVRRQQQNERYALVYVESDGVVVAVAGYRRMETLAWGRVLYVDDLVTSVTKQGMGYGRSLMGWLLEEARRLQCDEFHLDSGVQRFGAHRFYLRHGLDITCHHFSTRLAPVQHTPHG